MIVNKLIFTLLWRSWPYLNLHAHRLPGDLDQLCSYTYVCYLSSGQGRKLMLMRMMGVVTKVLNNDEYIIYFLHTK